MLLPSLALQARVRTLSSRMERSLTVPHSILTQLRQLETRFLKPHRRAVALALAGMLVQSALLLPIPLLQGGVVDRLVGLAETGPSPPTPLPASGERGEKPATPVNGKNDDD